MGRWIAHLGDKMLVRYDIEYLIQSYRFGIKFTLPILGGELLFNLYQLYKYHITHQGIYLFSLILMGVLSVGLAACIIFMVVFLNYFKSVYPGDLSTVRSLNSDPRSWEALNGKAIGWAKRPTKLTLVTLILINLLLISSLISGRSILAIVVFGSFDLLVLTSTCTWLMRKRHAP